MKDFKSYIVDAYAIPREIVISDGSPTDIRAWCDTVDDFELFLQETGMELRYDGLISKERSGGKRLMLCSGSSGAWVWTEVLLGSSNKLKWTIIE